MLPNLFITVTLLLQSITGISQTKQHISHLYEVKSYLLAAKTTVNKRTEREQKVASLDSLIRLATRTKEIFTVHINPILRNRPEEIRSLNQSLNFILQSIILYKTDLKNRQEKAAETEMQYLNKQIPYFTNKIDEYCKSFKTSIE